MAKGVKRSSKFGVVDTITVPTDTHKHEHTHTHDDVYEQEPIVKPTKDKRIQILTYSNLIRRMDNYAKRHGLSRAEVFEQAVNEFLDNH